MKSIVYIISSMLIFCYFLYVFFMMITPQKKIKRVKKIKQEEFYFFFLIPCLNEEKVIAKTLKRLLALPCPNMVVIPIDDHSEDRTVAKIKKIKDSRVHLLERKKPNAQLGKGSALNEAYQIILKQAKDNNIEENKIIIGILDGDGHLSKNAIPELCKVFSDPNVSAAQCRVSIKNNHKILTLLQDIEFFTMISDLQNTRGYTQSVGLGGNGQFMRLSKMKKLGREIWGDSLLEDYDMTLRIFLLKGKISYLSKVIVYQQGLSSIKKLVFQRSRWVQGNLQCLKYVPELAHSPNVSKRQKIDIYYFLAQPIINLLGSLIVLISWIYTCQLIWDLIQRPQPLDTQNLTFTNWLLPISVLLIMSIGPGMFFSIKYYLQKKKIRERNTISLFRVILSGFAMSLYCFLTIPSVWIAFYRFTKNNNSWLKTERE